MTQKENKEFVGITGQGVTRYETDLGLAILACKIAGGVVSDGDLRDIYDEHHHKWEGVSFEKFSQDVHNGFDSTKDDSKG